MIEHGVCVDGEVSSVVRVVPVHPDDGHTAQQSTEKHVDSDMERDQQRIDIVSGNVPVKGWKRVETKAFRYTGDSCEGEIVG